MTAGHAAPVVTRDVVLALLHEQVPEADDLVREHLASVSSFLCK